MRNLLLLMFSCTIAAGAAHADEEPTRDATAKVGRIRLAVQQSLALLEKASAGSADNRKCFTCHSQALPVFAIARAKRAGFEFDSDNFQRQIKHTHNHLQANRKRFFEDKGPGGGVDTAGYALWTLEDGDQDADEVTRYVTDWILKKQRDDGRWKCSSNRPPSEASDFTTTYVALRALQHFSVPEQQAAVDQSSELCSGWLIKSKPTDTEDQVFRLLAFDYVDPGRAVIDSAIAELKQAQRNDGGWSQTDEMASDAYATSLAMYALSRFEVDRHGNTWQRGLRFLLDQQHADGSWHVISRSKPFQEYFESGFPHGKDQFISTTATAWATIVLIESMPE